MKSIKVWVMLAYLTSIFMFMGQSSNLLIWCLFEFNMVMMVSMLFFFDGLKTMMAKSETCFLYFMIQSIGSMMFLLYIQHSTDLPQWIQSSMIYIIMFLKLGMFPFQFWLTKISVSLLLLNFSILMTIQKIPLMSIMFMGMGVMMMWGAIICLLTGPLMMVMSINLKEVMIYSSIYSLFWMYFIFSSSITLFLTFYILYSIHLISCMKNNNLTNSLLSILSYMFFLGLPPLSMFFYKLGLMKWMVESLNYNELIYLWGATFLALFGYMNMFQSMIVWKSPNKMNLSSSWMMVVPAMILFSM